MDQKNPLKASHRFIRKLLEVGHGGKVSHFPQEYELVSRIFRKAGGSWEKAFQGSSKDVDLLKKVIKLAVKKEYITPAAKWGKPKTKPEKKPKTKPEKKPNKIDGR